MQKPILDHGLLWFDDDPKLDLFAKVERAVKYFQKKYKVEPNYCQVNPCMIQENSINSSFIEIKSNPKILPYHFWIGTKEVKSD